MRPKMQLNYEARKRLRNVGALPSWQIAATLPSQSDASFDYIEDVDAVLTYNGGLLINNMTLYLIWGYNNDDGSGGVDYDRVKFEQFAADLMQTEDDGGYFRSAIPYTNYTQDEPPVGTFMGWLGGSVTGPLPMPSTMNGSEAVDYIFATIDAGLITFDASRPGADTTTIVYALMMPPGTTSLLDPGGQYEGSSCQVFCGYHSGERGILFMVIVDPSCPGCAPSSLDNVPSSVLDIACSTLAHECVETVTDSDGTGWNDPNTGEENADICNRKLTPWGPWLIQGYFVNEHNPDEVEPDSDD